MTQFYIMSPDLSLNFVFSTDCYLWEKLLCVSQKCFQAAHEKHSEVCVKLSFLDSSFYVFSLLADDMFFDLCPRECIVMC